MENRTIVDPQENEVKWGGLLNEFFWLCSGANRTILRQCPTEYSKYFGIGGTIFFTAAMATLSGGYAFYTIFQSQSLAICFGIFWGLLIFNLDRFIVNTMYSDGKYTISLGELMAGLPRLIIALFLGIVISTPLEMKIFEDRINSQIVKDNARRTSETRKVASEDYIKLEELTRNQTELFNQRAELEKQLSLANKELKEEGEGSALSKQIGHGPIYKEKLEYRDKCQEALDSWNSNHKSALDRLDNDIEYAQNKIRRYESDIERGTEENGFCVRYEAFANVKIEVPAARVVSLFIMMLFIIIEIAPTFFKMMIASGPYDEKLKEEMERKKAMSILNVSKINDDANTQIQIVVAKNKDKLEAEIAANKIVLEKIAAVQTELLNTAIEEWKQEEMAKIHDNPSKYIKSTASQTETV